MTFLTIMDRLSIIYERLSVDLKKRTGWSLVEIMFLIGCIVEALLMLLRCFFGTEFTDEAFCVSDALAVMHGNVPFAYDTLLYVGESFFPIVLYKIYEYFVPDLTGILLFSRLSYTLVRLIVIFSIYKLLKKEASRKWRLIISAVLIPYMGGIIQDFSYNTISSYLVLLIAVWIYTLQKKNGRSKRVDLYICGFLSGIAVFAHPVHILSILVFILLIFINSSKEDKIGNCISYCAGGITEIFIVFIPIIYQVGISKTLYGIETMFTCGQDLIKSTVLFRGYEIIVECSIICAALLCMTFATYMLASKYIYEDNEVLTREKAYLFSVTVAMAICSVFIAQKASNTHLGVLCAGVYVLIMSTKPRCSKGDIGWYLGLPTIGFIIFMTFGSTTGFSRFIYCLPMVIVLFWAVESAKSKLLETVTLMAAICIILAQGYADFKYIYRDDRLSNLNTVVASGVYKGIFTTDIRAKDIVELEEYISTSIRADESVSFRDNVPVAYLMRNKNICDIKTWDDMQWTYGCNDPTGMYRYYKNRDMIPDVICYIDFGRDESLSVENSSEKFQFNDFVNAYYILEENSFQNDTFRALIYRNKGTFDYDFDALIESVD